MSSAVEDKDIEAAAAAWVVRMDRSALNAEEQRELDAWLAGGTRRLGAFIRAQAIWTDADRVIALDTPRAAVVAPPEPRFHFKIRFRLAASIAAVLAVAALTAYGYFSGREVTDLGEIRRFTLNDGSSVILNTSSVVQVRFEERERRVVLREGEATFQVAHDVDRPFVVQARDVSVKAIGTAFSVRLRPNGVAVTVTEGVVEVVRPSGTENERQLLERNTAVVAAGSRPMSRSRLTPAETSRRLAWQEGLLEFDGERLAQAALEVNRYSPVPVIIDSPRLAEHSFVGVFRTGDSKAFADSAAAAFNARVVEAEDGLHLIE
jgi:transmembrane sensor